MRNIVVGTAGHIDHGKTALVRALTGIDTDRLAEEKQRGISIELGFAHLEISDKVRIGFVDVPGHERFVKNMLAGVGGIDLVLLVIAADESIKPQTREHFDICRLLGIRGGVIALTKSDLVDPDILELVHLEVSEFVEGSFLENAPIVATSTVTGTGIEELRERLREAAASVRTKDTARHFRLPVDRVFTMRGFGTVVTGTLVSGTVEAGDEVEVHPLAERLRVRGIEVHGEARKRAVAGQRTALNLAGGAPDRLRRGMTLTHPGLFVPAKTIDCRFDLLPSAKPLKHRAPVHFHAGTAEVVAEARLLETNEPLRPGGSAFVRFLLREPVLLLPGDRFIVRMFSPVITIGGGTVLDIAPPARRRRREIVERLERLLHGSPSDRILERVRETGFGRGLKELVARTGMTVPEIEAAADDKRLVRLRTPETWLADAEQLHALQATIRSALKEFHRSNPLQPGISKMELRSRLLSNAPPFFLDALLEMTKDIVAEAETVRLASHRLNLKEDEEEALRKIEAAFRRAGLKVPATPAVLANSGVEAARARSLLQILLRRQRLIRIGEDLVFHHSAIEALRETLAAHKGERFKVPAFKEWTGISRKYAIPLLEYLDREHVTRREGDERVVL